MPKPETFVKTADDGTQITVTTELPTEKAALRQQGFRTTDELAAAAAARLDAATALAAEAKATTAGRRQSAAADTDKN